MWVPSSDSDHVFVQAVVFLDVSLSIPVVECILPYSVFQFPFWHLEVRPEAENRIDNDVLVSHAFLTAPHDRVSNRDVLEVTTIDELHPVDLYWRKDGGESR